MIYAVRNNVTNEPVLVQVGTIGYFPTDEATFARLRAVQTDAQTKAAEIGSMFGWDVPAAEAAKVTRN